MGITKLRANQIFGYSSFPKAYLNNLIPSSNRPNTTGDFILEGAFFTQNMTVLFEGQTVNNITFVSDNKVIVNLTTGAAEGTFDITLNNGSGQIIFTDALFIVLGDVFEPTTADWNSISGSINLTKTGYAKTKVYSSVGSAIWNKSMNKLLNYSVRFNLASTDLGPKEALIQNDFVLYLTKASDATNMFGVFIRKEGPPYFSLGVWDVTKGFTYYIYTASGGATYQESFNKLIALNYEFRCVSGTMYFYIDNVLKYTFTNTPVTENLNFKPFVNDFDISNIKYIELT